MLFISPSIDLSYLFCLLFFCFFLFVFFFFFQAEDGIRDLYVTGVQTCALPICPNSLWRNGSRAFFKDQRAHQIGDILTVIVNLNDKAVIANETQRSRENKEDSGVDTLFGAKKYPIMNTPVGTRIFTGDSNSSSDGKGSVNRSEALVTNVAGVVTQVLPNGNLVVEGKQEVRVNFEIRELIVAGIVRPEDIQSDNTIDSTKIAEARIAYGGRGQITDVQQPRYGQQVMDIILPF